MLIYAKQWKMGGKIQCLFLSSSERLFRTTRISISLSFFTYPKELNARQKSLSSDVERWGALDEWSERKDKGERNEIWGIKRRKLHLETFIRSYFSFLVKFSHRIILGQYLLNWLYPAYPTPKSIYQKLASLQMISFSFYKFSAP